MKYSVGESQRRDPRSKGCSHSLFWRWSERDRAPTYTGEFYHGLWEQFPWPSFLASPPSSDLPNVADFFDQRQSVSEDVPCTHRPTDDTWRKWRSEEHSEANGSADVLYLFSINHFIAERGMREYVRRIPTVAPCQVFICSTASFDQCEISQVSEPLHSAGIDSLPRK